MGYLQHRETLHGTGVMESYRIFSLPGEAFAFGNALMYCLDQWL